MNHNIDQDVDDALPSSRSHFADGKLFLLLKRQRQCIEEFLGVKLQQRPQIWVRRLVFRRPLTMQTRQTRQHLMLHFEAYILRLDEHRGGIGQSSGETARNVD